MKDIFRLEHKKLWGRKVTKICVTLCFIYVIVFDCVLSYQWFSFGSCGSSIVTSNFDRHFDGYSNIRKLQRHSLKWDGRVTDESLQAMIRDYQQLQDAETEEMLYFTLSGWVSTLWPELADPDTYEQMIDYVNPDDLTGFYERRLQVLEHMLESGAQRGKERELLLKMNEKVQMPFLYEWSEGWQMTLDRNTFKLVMAVFIAIVLSTMFAGEWADNMSPLILTTKNGWKTAARAKICTGLIFTLELFGLLTSLSVLAQLFFLGTSGWNMPVQIIRLTAVAPWNMLQAEIYEYACILLGSIGYTGIVLFLSALAKNSYISVLCSLGVVYLPRLISNYLPRWIQKALDLIPLSGNPTDFFRTKTFCILGYYIWSPWLLLTIPVLLGCCFLPLIIKRWARPSKL